MRSFIDNGNGARMPQTFHEAISAKIAVFGEVKGGRVVYAYADDQRKASDVRVKK
jgi:branched-chain amino acid transport system substrate-binding protein